MGIASEIDIYLKKYKSIGLAPGEMSELQRLWGIYEGLNHQYGSEIRSLDEVLAEG